MNSKKICFVIIAESTGWQAQVQMENMTCPVV